MSFEWDFGMEAELGWEGNKNPNGSSHRWGLYLVEFLYNLGGGHRCTHSMQKDTEA